MGNDRKAEKAQQQLKAAQDFEIREIPDNLRTTLHNQNVRAVTAAEYANKIAALSQQVANDAQQERAKLEQLIGLVRDAMNLNAEWTLENLNEGFKRPKPASVQ